MNKHNIKFMLLLACVCLLSACNSNRTINSGDLAGRYKIDFSKSVKQQKANDDDISRIIASLITMGVDVNVCFYDNNKGVFEVSGWAPNLFDAIGGHSDNISGQHIFEYRIKNDSILQIKFADKDKWISGFIIRKPTGTFDYLQIVDNDKGVVELIKIGDVSH